MADKQIPSKTPWRAYHLVQGAWEIAREGQYVTGVICVAHTQEDSDYIVNSLNYYEQYLEGDT